MSTMSSLNHNTNDSTRPAAAPWRVLIVDDHPLYRAGLRELFKNGQGLIVAGEAENEEDALRLVVALKPDLVTVDVSLASGNGLSLISRIKQQTSTPHVLGISMYDDRAYADLALAAGASGYLCKHAEAAELQTALETIRRGEIYVSPNVVQSLLRTKRVADQPRQLFKEKQLSSRELQIFNMIGQGKNTHEIAAELSIAVSTVETYRERLKSKLNLASGSELSRHAFFWAMQNSHSEPASSKLPGQ